MIKVDQGWYNELTRIWNRHDRIGIKGFSIANDIFTLSVAPLCIMGPPCFRFATLILSLIRYGQFEESKLRESNRDERWESRRKFKITLKRKLDEEHQHIKEIDFQRKNDWFSSELNIILWIVSAYCSVNITCLKSQVRTRSVLCQHQKSQVEPGYDTKKILSCPASQNMLERRREKSRWCICTRKIPRVHTLSLM